MWKPVPATGNRRLGRWSSRFSAQSRGGSSNACASGTRSATPTDGTAATPSMNSSASRAAGTGATKEPSTSVAKRDVSKDASSLATASTKSLRPLPQARRDASAQSSSARRESLPGPTVAREGLSASRGAVPTSHALVAPLRVARMGLMLANRCNSERWAARESGQSAQKGSQPPLQSSGTSNHKDTHTSKRDSSTANRQAPHEGSNGPQPPGHHRSSPGTCDQVRCHSSAAAALVPEAGLSNAARATTLRQSGGNKACCRGPSSICPQAGVWYLIDCSTSTSSGVSTRTRATASATLIPTTAAAAPCHKRRRQQQ